jgi:uncharacterized protein
VNRFRVDERDLEAEHALPWLGVDQLDALPGQIREGRGDIVDLVGDVVHAGAALREKAAHRRIVAERSEQLDAARADLHRGCLHALLLDQLPVLEPGAEHLLVGPHRLVEIRDRDADVVDSSRFHAVDATPAAPRPAPIRASPRGTRSETIGLVDQRLSLVTLGVADLPRARAFYEALGWRSGAGPDDDVVFFQAGGLVVALWSRGSLAVDSGVEDGGGWGGVTLALNVRSPREVDAVIAEAGRAGARIAREGAETFWGGYSGVFVDPDGHPWEVAHNPHWTLADDGSVTLRG